MNIEKPLNFRGEKCLKFAGATLGVFLLASWIMTFIIAVKYQYVVRVEEPFALFDQLYDKPWMRIGPYFIGMLAGYFLFKVNCKVTLSPMVVVSGWVLSLACLASLVYGVSKEGLVVPLSAFYVSSSIIISKIKCKRMISGISRAHSLGFGPCLDNCSLLFWIRWAS